MSNILRAGLMVVLVWAGYLWLAPRQAVDTGVDVRFEERAAAAGCRNVHTMVVLGNVFTNIMPWLCSVGAAAAAADYDNAACTRSGATSTTTGISTFTS
jgi:hypothetical protein